jgi:hypothetical protein
MISRKLDETTRQLDRARQVAWRPPGVNGGGQGSCAQVGYAAILALIIVSLFFCRAGWITIESIGLFEVGWPAALQERDCNSKNRTPGN